MVVRVKEIKSIYQRIESIAGEPILLFLILTRLEIKKLDIKNGCLK